ncbi:MAG: DMT family transporter [Casimicrobiaceae bacterium]
MSVTTSLLALHASIVLFGFAGLFGKWIALSAVTIVVGRTLIAAATLGVVASLSRETRSRPSLALIVNGGILALHWVAFFAAIKVSTVAIGLLGYASFPLFVLLLERVHFSRRWHGADAITALAVTLGLALLVPVDSWDSSAAPGLAWGVLSGLSFALLAVRNRGLRNTHSAIGITLWQNAFAALCLLPVLAWQGVGGTVSAESLRLLLVLGVLCTALAHTLFIASLAQLTAHTASVVAALEPVYGITLAVLLLDEIPDWHTIAGAVLIVGASIYASRHTSHKE